MYFLKILLSWQHCFFLDLSIYHFIFPQVPLNNVAHFLLVKKAESGPEEKKEVTYYVSLRCINPLQIDFLLYLNQDKIPLGFT